MGVLLRLAVMWIKWPNNGHRQRVTARCRDGVDWADYKTGLRQGTSPMYAHRQHGIYAGYRKTSVYTSG